MEFKNEFTTEEDLKITNEFIRLKDSTYLDSAGAVLYGENQIREISEILTTNIFSNPHTSRITESLIDQVRYRILNYLNADPDEYSIIFTSGCTAALKIVGESFQFNDGAFYYLTDSHTSLLGLREIVATDKIIPLLPTSLFEEQFNLDRKSLIAFPAQCNYNGYKYNLDVIEKLHKNENNYVLLDAAAYLSSNLLDLKLYKPDYVTLSFYKIFGYPTGLGALIVSKRGAENIEKKYYGGGTVKIALTRKNWHQKRDVLHEKFEDGTISYLSIISLQTSIKFMERLLGSNFIVRISRHVFNLGKYLFEMMKSLKHHNNQSVVVLYHTTNFNINTQSGIVNFNLKNDDGSYIGYAEFSSIASLHNIVIRTGCFCNPGACQTHLNLSNEDLMKHFNAGHVCGDENDLVDGIPTGSIRVSFGYMNTKEDADKLIEMIQNCYVQKVPQNQLINTSHDETKLISEMNFRPILKSIRIYPIKSCGPMHIDDEWMVTNKGFKYDREWMIVNGNGTSLTQKNETKMCLIKPFIDLKSNTLRLDYPYASSIEIKLQNDSNVRMNATMCETKICGERINGFDCGNEISEWLSNVLMIDDLRLIKQSDQNNERKNGNIALANQAQFLLISEPSVQWLMNQVEKWDYEGDIDNIVDRFRGNLVVENVEPLIENEWKRLRIGEVEFEVQGPCTRCQMICIDQSSGEKTTEPLRTIGKVFKGKTKFGIYLRALNNFKNIKCGENVDSF